MSSKKVLNSPNHGNYSALWRISYKKIPKDFGKESVAKCKAGDSVRKTVNSIIVVFLLYAPRQTVYLKYFIGANLY